MPKITKKMPIMELINRYPETMKIFMKYDIPCIGCVAAQFENIEEGAKAHGIDPDKLVSEINKAIEKKGKRKK